MADSTSDPKLVHRRQMLYGVSLFTGLDASAFSLLASLATESRVPAGHDLVKRGEAGTKLFFIVKGAVSVLRLVGKTETEIARLRDGDFFGEMCILDQRPRSATIRALEDTHCLMLSGTAFQILYDERPLQHHIVISNMARALSTRLRELGDFMAERS